MAKISVYGTTLVQWEKGRRVKIEPLRGMRVDYVHFCNHGDTVAIPVKPTEENGQIFASIPNILLQDGRNLVVYVANISGSKEETFSDASFSVRKRPKPADYVYTETEILSYTSLDKRLARLEGEGLTEAVNTALAQAKENGAFDGKDGQDGRDGVDGKDGSPGKDGSDGQPGKDGTSPVVSVSTITGGHRITVTDVNGTRNIDVMDGRDGQDGHTPQKGIDYFTEAEQKSFVKQVIEALPVYNGEVV